MEYRVEIGGVTVALKYTFNAMCAVEDRAGGALDARLERQYSAARLLLWGGMLDSRPEVTLEEAGELIGGHIARGYAGIEEKLRAVGGRVERVEEP